MSSVWYSGLLLVVLLVCLWLVLVFVWVVIICIVIVLGVFVFGIIINGVVVLINVMVLFKIQCSIVGLFLFVDVLVWVCVGIGSGSMGIILFLFCGMINIFGDIMLFQFYINVVCIILWGLLLGGMFLVQVVDLKYLVFVLGGNGEVILIFYGQILVNQVLVFGSYISSFFGSVVILEYVYNEVFLGGLIILVICIVGIIGYKIVIDVFLFIVIVNVFV